MIRRTARHALRWAGGLAATLAAIFAIIVWRISVGPVSLDFLAPYLAARIEEAQPGMVVRIDHTLVSLDRDGVIDILARGVHVGGREGEALLTLPELSLGLSSRAALVGVLAPTRIILRRPELRLERAEDGVFRLGLGAPAAAGGDWVDDLLRDLAAPPDRRGWLGYLVEVAVRNAALTVDDRALGVTWQTRRADATVFRSEAGIFGDLALTVELPGGGESELHSDFRYTTGADRFAIQLGFSELRPALFAGAAPGLAPLAALDLPLSGQLHLQLDVAAARITDAWCDVALGSGRLVQAALEGGALTVTSGQLRGDYDPAQGRVTIQQLRLDLGGPQFSATATIDGLGGGILAGSLPPAIDVAAELRASDVPADALPGLWPERLARNARHWVVGHIHDGAATAATAQIGAHVDFTPDAAPPVRLDSFAGTLDYRGLTVDYFPPLPPLRGVDGTARFDRAHFDLFPTTGAVKSVTLTGGSAKLSKLDTNDEEIAIDAALSGPLADVLKVLDSDPLRYPRKMNLDPAHVAGEVEGHALFNFPLKHDLDIEQVDFGARAHLSGVSIARVLAGRDLTEGEFQLQLDRAALRLEGTGRFADLPATLGWTQSLRPGDPTLARYTIRARLDDAARLRFAVDFLPEMVKGPVDVDLAYAVLASKRASAILALDLKDAALAVSQLNWAKEAGVPATATIALDLADDRIQAIPQATLKGGGADLRLSAAFSGAAEGIAGISRIDAPRLIIGETDASAALARRKEGGWQIELRGLSFDATGLMADRDHSGGTAIEGQPLVVDATLDRLLLGPKREARQVRGRLYSDGRHWQAASIDAAMFGGGKATLRFGAAGGRHSFHLSTDDFGALLRLLNISENLAGGQLDVMGEVEDKGPRRLFRGKVDGANYRLVHAPLFARLLSVASFSGIAGLLSGDGIPFSRLVADFTVADGKIDIKDLRAYGGSIGVMADGVFDVGANTLDVVGTLVPAYTINSVLGNIPLVGPMLMGGEGEGIFGANFEIEGPVSDPDISVNPLSVLAPGVLRELFRFAAPPPSTGADETP